MKRRVVAILVAGLAGRASAHGFEERYDLPVPLSYIVASACAVLVLTFIGAAFFARSDVDAGSHPRPALDMPRPLLVCTRGMAWLLFVLAVASALVGTGDPLMNLAPTLVWIIWWIGVAYLAALVDGVWPALDPFRTTFAALDMLARRLGRPEGLALGWQWPDALGMWPAALLLLAWCWLEIVYPLASSPFKLGCAALAWTAVEIAGMAAFGRATWQSRADVFAVVFATLGRMAPLRLRIDAPEPLQPVRGQIGFVIAMLASVVFDGLHGGAAWNAFDGLLRRVVPQWMDTNNYFVGTAGLATVWLGFFAAYTAALAVTFALMRPALDAATRRLVAARLTIALVPIAFAYNVAHNFSSLVIQGQTLLQLLSDPFGRQWDLFGTARFYPDIGLIDARFTWFVAVLAIVFGHAASIWWSHRVVLAAGPAARRATLAMIPLTLLMVGYTGVSLTLIAEPMVVERAAAPSP